MAGISSRAVASALGVSQRTVLRDSAAVNAAMVGLVQGLDGKVYRSRPLDDVERRRVIGYVHALRHDNELSIRQIVADLDGKGVRRSAGWVSTVLRTWHCAGCSHAAHDAPEHVAGGVS